LIKGFIFKKFGMEIAIPFNLNDFRLGFPVVGLYAAYELV
jgi:hypothetical protein